MWSEELKRAESESELAETESSATDGTQSGCSDCSNRIKWNICKGADKLECAIKAEMPVIKNSS